MVYVENEIIGRRLRRIRLDFGYDYFEMGELLEISDGHYRKLERGIYGIDAKKILLMYASLGVDPLYLLTGKRKRTAVLHMNRRIRMHWCANCLITARQN